jgi:hypothetical protein
MFAEEAELAGLVSRNQLLYRVSDAGRVWLSRAQLGRRPKAVKERTRGQRCTGI